MRIILDNSDISFNVLLLDKCDKKIGSEKFKTFFITLFTDEPEDGLLYELADFEEDGVLRVPSQELRLLKEGQIKVKAAYSYVDSGYRDDTFDDSCIKATDLYLKHKC